MRYYLLFIFILFFAGKPANGQFVDIPDAAFLSALKENGVDTNGDGKISTAEAEAVNSLVMHNDGLRELTGIEAFINLDTLDCFGLVGLGDGGYHPNELTFLDVSSLVNLKYLDCSYNKITDIVFGEQKKLDFIEIGFNQLTDIDVSSCPNLSRMIVQGNEISYFNLEQNHNIEFLCINEISVPITICLSPEDVPFDNNKIMSEGSTIEFIGVCDFPFLDIIDEVLYQPENVEFTCSKDAIVYLMTSNSFQSQDEILENSLDFLEVTASQINEFDLSNVADTILWLVAIDDSGNISDFEEFFIFDLTNDDDEGDDEGDDDEGDDEEGDDEGDDEEGDDEGDDEEGDDESGDEDEDDEQRMEVSEIEVFLYPNPTEDLVTIDIADGVVFYFDIVNVKGQLMTRQYYAKSPFTIDVSCFKYGMYIFRIILDNQVYDKSLVRY